MSAIENPAFHDDEAARAWLENVRWPHGAFCPHCGDCENVVRLEGKSHRPGLWQCRSCRKQFTVTVGTVFERSKVPLHKWVYATYLLSTSKKGISAHQIHRMLGVTYKTAWFMFHRIREAMGASSDPMGGEGETVEMDETYISTLKKPRTNARGPAHKMKVVALVERGGRARSIHVANVNTATIKKIALSNVDTDSAPMTDEAKMYIKVGRRFARHEAVNHQSG